MRFKFQRRHRYLLSGLAVLATLGVIAATALADAPDPKIAPQSPTASVVSITHNASAGTTTVTVKGGWVWSTHTTDCNNDRAGVGVAVDWNDPLDPGNHVTTLNGASINVGSTLAVNGNSVDNVVHPTPGTTALGGSGKETDVTTPSQFQLWRGGCGTDTYKDAKGALHPEGIWGQRGHALSSSGVDGGAQAGLSHTYKDSSIASGLKICALMYDVHNGKTPSQNGGVGIPKGAAEITAGGAGHNSDNGAEKNAGTPLGNACVPIYIPSLTTKPSIRPNDTATVTGNNPSGNVEFALFGPGDPTCSGQPAFTQTAGLDAQGNAETTNTTFVADTAGTWRWRVSYSGDSNNRATTSACGVESFVVSSG